jgi:hypothetical protein
MRSNGEVEGPRDKARSAPRAHTVFQRPRRVTTDRSRTPQTIVRGRPHRSYCARTAFSAQTEAHGLNETAPLAATAAAAGAGPERRSEDLAQSARALHQPQTEGLCLSSSVWWFSLHGRVLVRPLTVKLRGRTTTPGSIPWTSRLCTARFCIHTERPPKSAPMTTPMLTAYTVGEWPKRRTPTATPNGTAEPQKTRTVETRDIARSGT